MKKIYFAFLLSLFVSIGNTFSQCMLYPVSLENRVNSGALIIEGKVIAKQSFWNEAHNYIYTSNKIQINQVLKGSINATFIEVITDGGEVGLFKQVVEPSLRLNLEDEGVFILNPSQITSQFNNPVFITYADEQGFIKFDLKENSARDHFNFYTNINEDLYSKIGSILKTNLPEFINTNGNKFDNNNSIMAAISSISPSTITAGTFSVLTINGSGFGTVQNASNFVEFRNADDGGATFIQPHSSQYVSWTNNQIQVMVPTRAGTVNGTAGTGQVRVTVANSASLSATTLTINHGEINVFYSTNSTIYNTRHVNLNLQGGVTWRMFTGFDSNAPAKASFIRAMNTWRCNTNINWPLGATTTVNTIASDGVCVVRFDVGSELPGGVLGRCTSYFGGCSSGPNVFWYISELDIVFDSGTTWQYGPANATAGQMDFESVALHELGHGHQLSHVINTNNVMHYSIGPAQNKRVLSATDIIGGNNVMSRNVSPGVCGYGAMTAISPATCSLTAPTASFNVTSPICTNQILTLTNLSTGAPTNYTWTMTGGSPATATTQNTSVSYATAGTKTISLVVANGVGSSSVLSKTISVVAGPSISVPSGSTCAGNPTVLTASGASSYTWNPGGLTGATQTLNPINTTTFTIIGSNGSCTNSAIMIFTVVAIPNITAPNATICGGSSTVIAASGASSYTWNPGNLSGASQTLNPSSTTVYTITGVNNTCVGSKTITVTVNTCSGLNEITGSAILNVYPNPTTGKTNITTNGNFTGNLNVFNTIGQLIITKQVSGETNLTIDLSNEAKGVYLIKLISNNGNETYFKLIKE